MSVYLSDLDHALFFTLSYSDYFNFPLTKEEIFQRLPKVWDWPFLTGQKFTTDKLPIDKSKTQVEKSLKKLADMQIIEKIRKKETLYYFIKGREKIVSLRMNKMKIATKRQPAIDGAASWLKRFPTIKAVALTGSSALNNAALDDDLDFCIISKKNTLWFSRFFLILLAKLLNKQPQIDSQAKVNNKQAWCFNLWLDESFLNIAKRGISVYQAYELKQMIWLIDKENIHKSIVSNNRQLYELLDLNIDQNLKLTSNNELINYFFWPINFFFYYLQIFYRYLFFGKESYLLTFKQAHFNEFNRQEEIFQAIKKKMRVNAFLDF